MNKKIIAFVEKQTVIDNFIKKADLFSLKRFISSACKNIPKQLLLLVSIRVNYLLYARYEMHDGYFQFIIYPEAAISDDPRQPEDQNYVDGKNKYYSIFHEYRKNKILKEWNMYPDVQKINIEGIINEIEELKTSGGIFDNSHIKPVFRYNWDNRSLKNEIRSILEKHGAIDTKTKNLIKKLFKKVFVITENDLKDLRSPWDKDKEIKKPLISLTVSEGLEARDHNRLLGAYLANVAIACDIIYDCPTSN